MKGDFRIAAVVCRCPVGQVARNLERTRHWVSRAKQSGAVLVCFPEMNLTGYSNRKEIAEHAIGVEGPEVDALRRLAVDEGICLLVGFAEKARDEKVYASQMVVAPNGRTGIYRKLQLAPPEMEHFIPGESLPVFNWSGLRFGIQLCYDAHFPEIATRMAEAEADVIFIPHASPRGVAQDKHQSWMRHLPARAYDNSLFVVACNQTGGNDNGLTFPGNAVVFSPSGEIVTTRLSGSSGLLLADLKADQLHHVRSHRMRYFFPNRRPWLYRQEPVINGLDNC
jgi:N-carbamoylputrescine amidase